ncbi:MAG: aquaporin, partial [Thermoplasmata archaeon]
LALALSRRIDVREAPPHIVAQLAGALVGSAGVLLLIGSYADLGATVPASGEVLPALAGEFAFTALLVASVFYLADRGAGVGRWRWFLPGTVVGLSTYVIGPLSGSSLNPARSLAPALVSGTFTDLGFYLGVIPLAAIVLAGLWKPTSVDRLDRGPGRLDTST